MFDYTICTTANFELFLKQCASLEEIIPHLKKLASLKDVDGSSIQRYIHPQGKVTVKNDLQVDALYVQADFDLAVYFK